MSHGFGSTKQPDACNVRKVAVADVCCGEFMSTMYANQESARGSRTSLMHLARSVEQACCSEGLARTMPARPNSHDYDCVSQPARISKSAAVGHWCRRSGRDRELAGKR